MLSSSSIQVQQQQLLPGGKNNPGGEEEPTITMDVDDVDDDFPLTKIIEEIELLQVNESFFLQEVDYWIGITIAELRRHSVTLCEYFVPSAASDSQRRRRKRLEKVAIEIAIEVKKGIENFILMKSAQKRRGSFEKMVFFVKDYTDRRRDGRKIYHFYGKICDAMQKALTDPRNNNIDNVDYVDDVNDVNDVIVGRDEDINAIKTKLMMIMSDAEEWNSSSSDIRSNIDPTSIAMSSSSYVAYILGDPGVGKTAVTRKIYHDNDVRSHFDCFAWIANCWEVHTITAVLLKHILSQLIITMGTGRRRRSPSWDLLLPQTDHHHHQASLILDDEEGASSSSATDDVEILKRRLYDFLKDKRYLIVLDNFGKTEAWQEFFTSKPRGLEGSRVLIAYNADFEFSEEEQIGKGYYFHNLEPLSEANSWEMFINKVSNTEPLQSFPDLESMAKQVVGKYKGKPLSILGIAKQLSDIETTSYSAWFQFLNTLDKQNKTDHLDEQFSSLSIHLHRCLDYLLLFPKNYEIPVRRLVALWIAEEMVVVPDGHCLMDPMYEKEVLLERHFLDLAMEYLQKLIDMEIVQVTHKKLVDGKPKTCRLNQIWYQRLVSQKKKKNQSTTTSSYSSIVGIRQLPVYHTHNIEPRVLSNKNLSFDSYRFLNSFLCFDYRRSYEPSRQVKYFLRRGIDKDCFLSLKVLDLEGVYKPVLPKEIERLKNLRYLGLRWTYIDELPSFLGNLLNLHTLDVKHTYINTFPEWIHKLKNLQHLYMSENHRGKFVYRRTKAGGDPHLAKLQTLWGIFIDEESHLMNGLDMLTNIRKLGLMYRLSTSQQQEDAMAQWLLKLDGLVSLRLKSKDQLDKPSVLSLKDFNNHQFLSKIYLLGDLKESLHRHSFPRCLRKLTLSASKLQDDPMPILGMLPTLTILRLYSGSYVGLRMHCSSSSFVQLKVLKMWKLEKLEEWIVDKGSMPKLKELDIRSCKGLNMLPAELQQITTIRELKLANMSETFTERVKLDKSWSIKDNLYFAEDQMDFPKKNVGTTLVANGASGSSSSYVSSLSLSSSSSLGSAVLLLLLARRGVLLPSSSPTPTKHATPIGLISFNSLHG